MKQNNSNVNLIYNLRIIKSKIRIQTKTTDKQTPIKNSFGGSMFLRLIVVKMKFFTYSITQKGNETTYLIHMKICRIALKINGVHLMLQITFY